MSDHDFEKRVQHKLDELKFTPSDAVWSRVESNLRREKPRRRGWLWIPVFAGLLATGGYYLWPGTISTTGTAHNIAQNKPGEKSGNAAAADVAKTNEFNSKKTATPSFADPDQDIPNNKTPYTTNSQPQRNTINKPGKEISPNRIERLNELYTTYPRRGSALRGPGKQVNPLIIGEQTGLAEEDENKMKKEGETQTSTTLSTDDVAINNDTSTAVTALNRAPEITGVPVNKPKEQPSAADTVSASPLQLRGINKNKKWQFGVSVSGGLSKLSEGPFGDLLKSASVADAAPMDRQSSNNFLFLPVTAGVPPPAPSAVKPGFAFSVGGYAGRQLNKRISFTIGLAYMQHNNIIQIGYRVDSSMLVNNVNQVANVSRYYRADQKSKFSNRYHFVEVPLQFHTRLNKGLKTPLYWDAGVTLAQMFASNALIFDSGTGVYYEDNTRFNKTQFALNTGFSIGLFSRSKLPVTFGPSLKYHATPLYKQYVGGRKQLLSASLDLRFQLNKK